MPVELDHLFICTSKGGKEADCLIDFGMTEGPGNTHPGQGTANRRFFFANAMLELLWVSDPVEAQSELVRPTHLWERWAGRGTGACPLGICFRPAQSGPADPPFSSWTYRPTYLPPSLSFAIASNAHIISEPFLFFLPFARHPSNYPPERRPRFDHAVGLREISRVELILPRAPERSPELQSIARSGVLQLREGSEYLLELGFDGEAQRKQKDFRPALPLLVRW
jgi:hypothetical protein